LQEWQTFPAALDDFQEEVAEKSVVEETFHAFCGAHRSLDGRSFAKLCRDCHLLDKRFTATDADLIFAKVVPSGLRRIDLSQFELALRLVADKKGVDVSEVCSAVALVKGPSLQATKADPVRFHDDKSTYTGTHIYGGPESGQKGAGHVPIERTMLSQTMLPSEPPKSWSTAPPGWTKPPAPQRQSSAQQQQQLLLQQHMEQQQQRTRPETPPPLPRPPALVAPCSPQQSPANCWRVILDLSNAADDLQGEDVESTFRAFCGNRQDLDGRSFTKLCRDCHLIDKALSAADCDLIFARVVPMGGQKRIDVSRFEAALRLVAEKKAIDELVIRRAVAGSSGPTMTATKADAVRFHDDKSTYTGTHLYGGPEEHRRQQRPLPGA